MKTVLVISSFVASSRVGATVSAFCLRRLGVETIVLPTTLMGRHPGWGAPGGGAAETAQIEDMWQAIRKQRLHFDAVLTGYMGHVDHAALSARIVQEVKQDNPEAIILVDPVMGDEGALYIPEDRAMMVKSQLVPLADILTPNVWELSYLTGKESETAPAIAQTAKDWSADTDILVTSVPVGGEIGALLVTPEESSLVQHKKFDKVPHGGGDALAATFLGHILLGLSPRQALEFSVASIFEVMSAAMELDAGELPIVRKQEALVQVDPLMSRKIEI
ncbi:PfkB family carbohydrate kinase [Litorimonas haliclonae]|uniref:PfkB family carbohydrate kinase n=1 Tax=Litorimonas haliclonae TaxID=2081977 RepID=UPI0039EEA7A0